jgi:hypothetical protein
MPRRAGEDLPAGVRLTNKSAMETSAVLREGAQDAAEPITFAVPNAGDCHGTLSEQISTPANINYASVFVCAVTHI